jgi:hypothetical protein
MRFAIFFLQVIEESFFFLLVLLGLLFKLISNAVFINL